MATRDRKQIGIIGLGRMGRCLVKGLTASGAFSKEHIRFTTRHPETAAAIEKELGLRRAKSNKELVQECGTIVLAVKPQNMEEVLAEIGRHVSKGTTVISIVASVSTADMERGLSRGVAVLRAMPNTPSFVGEGVTAICAGTSVGDEDWQAAEKIFKPLGLYVRVDEKHMDAVTGLSGCGPAYIYVVLESLTEAGIKVGLPRDLATRLAAQTVLGAAKMLLATGKHPAALKDEVTTPAGCTIDGLLELEEGKLRITLMKAVVQATKRARILAKKSKA